MFPFAPNIIHFIYTFHLSHVYNKQSIISPSATKQGYKHSKKKKKKNGMHAVERVCPSLSVAQEKVGGGMSAELTCMSSWNSRAQQCSSKATPHPICTTAVFHNQITSSLGHPLPFPPPFYICAAMPLLDENSNEVGCVQLEDKETGNYSRSFMIVDFSSHKLRLYDEEAEVAANLSEYKVRLEVNCQFITKVKGQPNLVSCASVILQPRLVIL